MAIRALVTLRLVSDVETATTLMRRVAGYTKEHFGDDLRFEPFIGSNVGPITCSRMPISRMACSHLTRVSSSAAELSQITWPLSSLMRWTPRGPQTTR
jgi:hypothetical protein